MKIIKVSLYLGSSFWFQNLPFFAFDTAITRFGQRLFELFYFIDTNVTSGLPCIDFAGLREL